MIGGKRDRALVILSGHGLALSLKHGRAGAQAATVLHARQKKGNALIDTRIHPCTEAPSQASCPAAAALNTHTCTMQEALVDFL